MRKTLNILASSFRLTIQELMVNKLRTALSLIGISFGIFCIIGVLATVNSLEMNIQNQIKSLGSNTIYIDKWNYSGGPDYPWWKYVNRPVPKFNEVEFIKQRSQLSTNVAYFIRTQGTIQYENYALQGVDLYGVSEEENDIQPVVMEFGRYMSATEFAAGSPVVIIGNQNALDLFGSPAQAIGKQIKIKDKSATVIGVIKKMGQSMIGWNYDQCVMLSYRFARQLFNEDNSNPAIMVKGKENISSVALADELEGVMRSIRKLGPKTGRQFFFESNQQLQRQGKFFIFKYQPGWMGNWNFEPCGRRIRHCKYYVCNRKRKNGNDRLEEGYWRKKEKYPF